MNVKIRLALLAVSGIVACLFIFGANIYNRIQHDKLIKVETRINQVMQEILIVSSDEKDFRANADEESWRKIKPRLESVTDILAAVSDDVTKYNSSENLSVDSLVSTFQAYAEAVAGLKPVVFSIKSGLMDYARLGFDMEDILQQNIISLVKQEIAMAKIEGQKIYDPRRRACKDNCSELISYLGKRRLNIEELYLFSNLDDFRKNSEGLDKETFRAQKNLKNAIRASRDKKFRAIYKQIEPMLDNLMDMERKLVELYGQKNGLMSKFEVLTTELNKQELELVEEIEAVVASNAEFVRNFNWSIIFIVTLTLSLWAFIISKSILTPLNSAILFADDIAKGNLSKKLDVKRKDEIGRLIYALNSMVTNLGQMFRDISDGVEILTGSSAELFFISGQVKDRSMHVTEKSNMVSDASNEMNANMDSVAAAIEDASDNSAVISTAANQMTMSINEVAQSTGKANSVSETAVDLANAASSKMDELGSAAVEIGKVTETIAEISEQTNLLALNATIESARAGEAGKGFAVVAGEIKALAGQTAVATNEIKKKIESIQQSTNETVREIGEIVSVSVQAKEIVSSIASAIEEQSSATNEIASNVLMASQGMQEVNEKTSQNLHVVRNIAKDIKEVNEASIETEDSSSQLNSNANELSKIAGQLKDMVGRFQV
ncbi:MAG: methyl-accepting chemotaxis protein [Desulfobacteraceae bacterium]|nr:methyl-accepting chemotaxis protein [Desulfobacteraceae bacterium]